MSFTVRVLVLIFLCTTSTIADEIEETVTAQTPDANESKGEQSKETVESNAAPQTLQSGSVCGYRMGNGGFPWLVEIYSQTAALKPEKVFECGGVLVASNVVLTSAHCVQQFKATNTTIEAQIGAKDERESRTVKEIIILDHFEITYHMNAIAILILSESFGYKEHINPICLPPNENYVDPKSCMLAFYDFKNNGNHRTIDFKMSSVFDCSSKLLQITEKQTELPLHESIICAAGAADVDFCEKMLGFPLICPVAGYENRYYLAGISSFDEICPSKSNNNLFVNVALFRHWIEYNFKQENNVIYT